MPKILWFQLLKYEHLQHLTKQAIYRSHFLDILQTKQDKYQENNPQSN